MGIVPDVATMEIQCYKVANNLRKRFRCSTNIKGVGVLGHILRQKGFHFRSMEQKARCTDAG
uniref:Uncharacterized protein n=1 Tax=Aegilops tauschii TaxID=37682 RepID=M8CGV6_AEGTA